MSKRLYVGNLAYQTTEGTITEAFGRDGRQVRSVQIMLDRDTGRSRGFAFVEMATDSDAEAAIQAMNGTDVDGRSLRVNVAEERRPGSGGRGGFGDRAGGSYGGRPSGGQGGGQGGRTGGGYSSRGGERGVGGAQPRRERDDWRSRERGGSPRSRGRGRAEPDSWGSSFDDEE